ARNRVPRGARLFVPPDGRADDVIREVQRFIRDHRPHRDGEQLTFHGLRYSDAQEHMRECVDAGLTLEQAERETARRLGHNRRRVVRTYTGPW
ncbi:MAG: hypothetical protein IBX71_10435, partial [Candidatus Desulforudis sp.]|nr:hypothetical protein [Desulforudis sp.]